VNRRKVDVAAKFLLEHFKRLEVRTIQLLDHLFPTTLHRLEKLKANLAKIRSLTDDVNDGLDKVAKSILRSVSRSEDDVSESLAAVFSQAVNASEEELERARRRKESGNPPGKSGDPLGDQITWEQILSASKSKSHLWIITRDSDYAHKYQGEILLNALLHGELTRTAPNLKIRSFDNIPDAIRDFSETTSTKAVTLPSKKEAEEIKKEQRELPPLDWLPVVERVSPQYDSLRRAARPRSSDFMVDPYVPEVEATPDKGEKERG